jgi:ATP-dependent Lon protease
MDRLDQLGAKAFAGFLVRKDLVRKDSRQYPVPNCVVQFLLGRYCASTDPAEIEEGLQIVEKQLQGRTVRTGEDELFKARARDQGSVKIIDIVRARLDTRSDSCLAEVPSLAIRDAQIHNELVRSNERMLTDGFYAEVSLEYVPVIAQERNGRPFRIAGLRPIQMSNLAKPRCSVSAQPLGHPMRDKA